MKLVVVVQLWQHLHAQILGLLTLLILYVNVLVGSYRPRIPLSCHVNLLWRIWIPYEDTLLTDTPLQHLTRANSSHCL